ncbi:MAG: hypothetical protein V7641_5134 [Blastocatellia bacterium]
MLGEETRDPCNECGAKTYHKILASADSVRRAGDDIEIIRDAHQIIQCQGCKKLSFKKTRTNRAALPNPDVTVQFFPARIFGRNPIYKKYQLPNQVFEIYKEAHRALADGSVILTGMGIRAIVEAICRDKNASGKTLYTKIDSLVSMNILTQDGAKVLHGLRVMGNEAAHSVKAHTIRELSIAFEVVDFLFLSAYVLPRAANDLGM